ncbi:MAG: 3-deoxy-7-phosphoheptulonate synthase [Pseudomonadota bacterium]|nr:3-deoxy-7-phosphoheptulonate synthase [Pseudomonadota bacterium]
MVSQLHNINVINQNHLPTPSEVKLRLPTSPRVEDAVLSHRKALQAILDKSDPRLFVVVGPCSIHDIEAAHEYAERLKILSDEIGDTLFIVMRVYFEKPRTTVGWKGLINDPDMDDSFNVEKGILKARELLLDLVNKGLPTATEALDPIMPQYIGDLIAWTAIGARTTESQTHREMSSGLSTPVGFKNGTDGSLEVAINALKSAGQPHHFLGINQEGQTAVFQTRGNTYGHVVLRGGGGKQNYDSASVALCEQALNKAGLPSRIVIDCSHANSKKNHNFQHLVAQDSIKQVISGNRSIMGFMLESNLFSGNQSIGEDLSKLKYGVSVTDACIDWDTTESILLEAADLLRPIVKERK